MAGWRLVIGYFLLVIGYGLWPERGAQLADARPLVISYWLLVMAYGLWPLGLAARRRLVIGYWLLFEP